MAIMIMQNLLFFETILDKM